MSSADALFRSLEKAEAIFQKWQGDKGEEDKSVWDSSDEDIKAYVGGIYSLKLIIERHSAEASPASIRAVTEGAKALLASVGPKIEEGFLQVLLKHSSPIPPERVYAAYKLLGDQSVRIDEAGLLQDERGVCFMSDAAMWRLHTIARTMIHMGHARACCRVLKSVRRPVVVEGLKSLNRGQFDAKAVPDLPWKDLEVKMEKWRSYVSFAVRVLLASERRICERVLDQPQLSDLCFAETCKGTMPMLFEYVEAFASGKRTPERLYVLLDCYETLAGLQPDFNVVFAGDGPCRPLRNEISVVMSRVGVAVRGVFAEFEKQIKQEPSRPPMNGSVHGMTSYVVNYLNLLFDYRETLSKLYTQTTTVVVPVPKLMYSAREEDDDNDEYVEEEVEEELDEDEEDADYWGEPLPEYQQAGELVKKKLKCLEEAMIVKAKQHKEVALQHFFLMNTVHYIARKVKETELRKLVGDDWIRDAAQRVQRYANEYMRQTWNKVTVLLNEDAHSAFRLRNTNKDKFVKFAAAFDEVYRVQRSWLVSPGSLHDELHQAVKYRVLSVYSDFYDRHAAPLVSGRNATKYVKYAPMIVNEMINDLFEGQTATS